MVEDTHFINGLLVFSYILFIFSVLFRYAPKEEKKNMDDTHRDILLNKLRLTFQRDLQLKRLLPHLGKVFDQTDEEEIKAEKIMSDQVDKMLQILTRKGPYAFNVFASALSKTQPHLSLALTAETSKENK